MSKLFLSKKYKNIIGLICLFNALTAYPQNNWLNFTYSNEVKDIIFQGNYAWAATSGGLLRINLETNEKYFFNRSNSQIPSNNISRLCLDSSNNIWVGTYDNRLARFDGENWEIFKTGVPINVLCSTALPTNEQWIVREEGIISFKNGNYDNVDISSLDFPYKKVSTVAIDFENNLWIGSPYGRIAKYNGFNFEIFDSKNSELSGARINKLKVDNSNSIWACTDNGIYKYNNNYRWEFISTSSSILSSNSNQFVNIFSNDSANIWLSDRQNLYFFSKDKVKSFNKNNSKFKGAYSLVNDVNGNVWIGHSAGLTLFDGSDWYEIDTLESVLFQREKEIFDLYKDTIWVEKNYKHYLIDSNSFFDAKSFVTNLTFDKTGNLWFRTSGELVKYDGENWILYDTANSNISTTSISSIICDDDNNLWIGTYTKGLMKFDGDEWIVYDSTNVLKDNRINSLNIFNDSIFVSTGKGLIVFDGVSWSEVNLGGYMSHYPLNIISDKKNNYWIGTNMGLVKFYGKDLNWFGTVNSGIAGNYISTICIDFYGNLWILTNGGINIFNEDGIKNENKIIDFFTDGI
jgi:ligand-binding sensor domain-containing protein